MRSDRMMLAVALLMLAGEGTAGEAAAARDKPPPTDPATLKATGKARHCITRMPQVSAVPVGDSVIMFRAGSRWYRNDLRTRCPSLSDDRILVFRTQGSQYCALDQFDVVEPVGRMSFGACALGEFTPVEVPRGTRFR
jgi:hypothetical protein